MRSLPTTLIPRLDPRDVAGRLGAGGQVVLVDVRAPEIYAYEHAAGARSIPARTVVARAHALPRDAEIVLY